MAGPTTNSTSARRKNTNRPNRAQLKAAEVRSAETVPGASAATVAAPAAVASGGRRAAARRQVSRAVTLSRAAEMQYIREDLRRLFYIAAPLFVLMIVLLLVID